MQETNEKLSQNVSSSINGVVSHSSVLIPRGYIAPYHQQAYDINLMLQNQMTIELNHQLQSLEERAALCIKVKNNAIENEKKRSEQLEIRLKMALAEADYWRKMSEQKTELCKDLATRLLKARKKEIMSTQMNMFARVAEEAESSTGDNGNDIVDTAKPRQSKRRCF